MSVPMLAFDAKPPMSVPLRFFLTAPAFALAAGLLLAWAGADALSTRWTPVALALVHLLAIGSLATTMIGALTQIMPVAAGAPLPWPRRVAAVVHPALAVGTIALAAGFVSAEPVWFRVAVVALGAAVAVFVAASAAALWRARDTSPTSRSVRLGVVAFAVTAASGLTFATSFGWALPLPTPAAVAQHALWGLGGWMGLVVAGVAFQVVPMFQLTAAFDERVARWVPIAAFALIAAGSLAFVALGPLGLATEVALAALLFAALAVFAFEVIRLQRARRRRILSPLVVFWRIALGSALGGSALWLALLVAPGFAADTRWAVLAGVLLFVGFGVTLVTGMIYKIVPFLAWVELQTLRPPRGSVPNMQQVLPDSVAWRQLVLLSASLVLLSAAALVPGVDWLARTAGLAFAVASAALWFDLVRLVASYGRNRRHIEALLREQPAARRPTSHPG